MIKSGFFCFLISMYNNGSVTFNLEVIALKIWLVSLLAIS